MGQPISESIGIIPIRGRAVCTSSGLAGLVERGEVQMGQPQTDDRSLESFRHGQIEAVLARIRPPLQADGVDIELIDVRDDGASVRVSGLPSKCASAPLSIHTGLVELLREAIPGFAELQVVLDAPQRERHSPPARVGASRPRGSSEVAVAAHAATGADSVVVGRCDRMRAVLEFVRVIGGSDSTVLITGESGTGKEVTALSIHEAGRRRHRPFVPVSCALFSETLVESELFGHERGAYTGALRDRPGRFEVAEGGTVFLDDVDDVPLSMQVKLLRVLQNRTVERLGSSRTIPVNVRVLAGTKRDLKQLVADGKFREDLYYRLNVLPVALPPLRERREDIPVLMDHFLTRYCGRLGKDVPAISSAVRDAFVWYQWPGNVRELENACERIAQTCTCGTVRTGCVSMTILTQAARPFSIDAPHRAALPRGQDSLWLDDRIRDLEASLISRALRAANGNKSRAAELLHIKRSTLGDRIRRCGLADAESELCASDDVADVVASA
jgi:DNA-binding NtrC family response regulator